MFCKFHYKSHFLTDLRVCLDICRDRPMVCNHISQPRLATTGGPIWRRNYIYVFLFLLSTLHPSLSSVVNAQTKSLETQAFTAGLSISASSGKILESVAGEISGIKQSVSSKRLLSGHSGNSHSAGVVSDLVTSTSSVGEGQVSLEWTHTGNDGNVGQASLFDIKVATFQMTNANFAAVDSALSVTALSPGTTSQRTVSNLPSGVLYYMAARTKDKAGIFSRVSPNSTFYTFTIAPDPVSSLSVVSSTGGALRISWINTGDDANTGDLNPGYFRIDYSTDSGHSFSNAAYQVEIPTTAAVLSEQNYDFTGLLGNATYYATVYIGDDITVFSGLSQIGEIVTMSYPPFLTGFSNISTGSFTANISTGNSGGTEYYLQISTYSDFSYPTASGWTSSLAVSFSGLAPRTTYYARGKARNFSGIETSWADFGSVVLNAVSGTYKPQTPMASGDVSGSGFTLKWNEVNKDIMGNSVSLSHYSIYVATSANAALEYVDSVPGGILSYSAAASPAKWYCARAYDSNGNFSDYSLRIKNYGESSNAVSDDSKATLDINKSVTLNLASNKLMPVVVNQPEKETGNVRAAYKVYFKNENDDIVLDRNFPGSVLLTMPLSSSGGTSAAGVKASYSDYDWAVYYDNGVESVKIGGDVNPSEGTISVHTRKTGSFEVKRVIRPQSFAITQTVPKKVFTPNGDGIWDEFHILFDNPGEIQVSDAKVYDLSGREIASLEAGTYNSNDSLMWDGKRNGETADAGIYIYQFKAGDKYYNGAMVLAR